MKKNAQDATVEDRYPAMMQKYHSIIAENATVLDGKTVTDVTAQERYKGRVDNIQNQLMGKAENHNQ